MQYRKPVGAGPSSKTWPRCASHSLHRTSMRRMKRLRSLRSSMGAPSAGFQKLGHPVPESNLASLSNSFAPQQTHLYVPASWLFQYSPVNGRSVPASRVTWYARGLSFARYSCSLVTGERASSSTTRVCPDGARITEGPRHGPRGRHAPSNIAIRCRRRRPRVEASPWRPPARREPGGGHPSSGLGERAYPTACGASAPPRTARACPAPWRRRARLNGQPFLKLPQRRRDGRRVRARLVLACEEEVRLDGFQLHEGKPTVGQGKDR